MKVECFSMIEIEEASHQLEELIRRPKADYIEAHLEENLSSYISYRGKELDSIGKTASTGGNVRALVNGGWGFVSFNNLNELSGWVERAIKQASLAASKKIILSPLEPVVDKASDVSKTDPTVLPLAEKKKLLDEYKGIIWSIPKIQTSVISYGDRHRKRIFLSSPGSHIRQERADVTLRLAAVTANCNDIQQIGISVGSRGDFDKVRGLHQEVEDISRNAVKLLSAPRIKGGEYTVVLDPVLAGVFVHEAFGHLSESDFIYENERLQQIMSLGRVFGNTELNIVDTATVPGLRGSYRYDDEGVPATKTYLIREGKLVGRLHSRETAAKMGEKPTGNARAVSYRYPPIVRMTNTYIEPGASSFSDLIADIEDGIYAKNWYGGTTSMEMFTFSSGEAYRIRKGKIAEQIKPVTLTGNVFDTLKNIDAIGNDLDMNQGGGCGKGGQAPLPVSNGSPHIRIRHCLIGGN
jgi:TldD protein